jgi:hypothetical protein
LSVLEVRHLIPQERRAAAVRVAQFDETVHAVVVALIREHEGDDAAPLSREVAEFVRDQHARMPDYLRRPLWLLTLALDLWPWLLGYRRPLRRLDPCEASRVLANWRTGWPAFRRDLVSFYEALSVYGLAALREEHGDG